MQANFSNLFVLYYHEIMSDKYYLVIRIIGLVRPKRKMKDPPKMRTFKMRSPL